MNYTRILSSIILFCFILGVFELLAQDVQKAKDLLRDGDAASAIELMRKVIKKDKKNSEAYLVLSEALLSVDSTDQAIAVLIQARELSPTNAQVYVLLGDAYVKQGIYAAAIQQYEEATKYDSVRSEIYVKLAEANMKVRRYKEAAVAYQRAIGRDTTNLENFRKLGNLFFLAKQYKNAVPFLERVVNLDSSAVQEQIQLVKSYSMIGAYVEVIPLAQRLVQTDSTLVEIMKILALGYAKTKNPSDAEKVYKYLEAQGVLNAEDYVELGKAQKALDKVEEAIASYEKAYIIDSTNSDIYYDLGSLYMKQKRYNDAVMMFERKIAADTSAGYQFGSYLNAGLCLMQTKDFNKARQYILKGIEIRPEYIQGWAYLASCYAQMDSTEQKVAAYKKVIDLATEQNSNVDNGKYTNQLAEAYQVIGFQYVHDKKYVQAIDYLKRGLMIIPKDCDLTFWLAHAYHNVHNKDEAIKYYKRALDICPKNDPKREDIKKALLLLGIVVD